MLPVGQGETVQEGRDLLFVGFGPIVARAVDAAATLAARGKRLVVTFEESVVSGGFGSAVLELIEEARLADAAYRDVAVRIVGIPGDRFVDHGSVADLRRVLRLDVPGLVEQVRDTLATLRLAPGRSTSDIA